MRYSKALLASTGDKYTALHSIANIYSTVNYNLTCMRIYIEDLLVSLGSEYSLKVLSSVLKMQLK